MRNSNHKFTRGVSIFFNGLIFVSSFIVLSMIIFYIIATLSGKTLNTTSMDASFQTFINQLINNNLFWVVPLIIYFGSMQLIYSGLIVKWLITLDDEQLSKHSWLILIYGFFNMTFWTAWWIAKMSQDKINTGMRVKRKLANHESKVFFLSGLISSILIISLLVFNFKDASFQRLLSILLGVTLTFTLIGILGLASLRSFKNDSLQLSVKTLKDVSTNSFMQGLAKVMIAFNIVFVLVKMLLLLLINTIGSLSRIFDRRESIFSSFINIANLVLMYVIVKEVFKAILAKDDEPLVITIPQKQKQTI